MIYFLVSILILTLFFTYLYKIRVTTVCPICAGVVITWFVGVAGIYTGQAWADPLLVAILLGVSLGALADKYGSRFGFIWKTLMVGMGLPAIYFLVQEKFWFSVVVIVVLIVTTFLFEKNRVDDKPPNHNQDLFKECC